jgi:imidazolonepropionase-like amidohydrolase
VLLLRWALLTGLTIGSSAAATLAIRDVTVIDGTGAPPVPHSTIVIQGERILELAPAAKARIPKGARVIDGRGRYAIPGLWDMHVHLWYEQNQLPVYVANGITGVRDMGSDFARTKAWRKDAESGKEVGPHIITSGAAVDGRKPDDPKLSVIVAVTPEDARRAFDRLDDSGVDFIKVLGNLSRDAYLALAERSRKWQVPFAGHVPASVSAWDAIEARQISIEHLFGLFVACANDPARVLDSFDESKARELFRRSALMETRQTPTLTLWERMARIGEAKRETDARLAEVPDAIRRTWPKTEAPMAPEDAAALKRQFELALRMVKLMKECGVEILAGTDTGDPYTIPGVTLHEELALLVKAGLSPMEALQTATSIPAKFLEWDEATGTLKRGMVADVVLLNANPLEDIRNVSRVHAVVLRGRYLSSSWIAATLRAVK